MSLEHADGDVNAGVPSGHPTNDHCYFKMINVRPRSSWHGCEISVKPLLGYCICTTDGSVAVHTDSTLHLCTVFPADTYCSLMCRPCTGRQPWENRCLGTRPSLEMKVYDSKYCPRNSSPIRMCLLGRRTGPQVEYYPDILYKL